MDAIRSAGFSRHLPTSPADPTASTGGEADRLRAMSPKEAATKVEGIFVSMLVGEMKKTLHEGGFFGNGPGSAVFDGMFDQMIGEEMAKRGGLGLGAFVEETLKAQAGAHQAQPRKADLEGTRPT